MHYVAKSQGKFPIIKFIVERVIEAQKEEWYRSYIKRKFEQMPLGI